jgi:RNA polymerase sigma-70 factor (ECF subfamily)
MRTTREHSAAPFVYFMVATADVPSDRSEVDWVRRAQAGDRNAFSQVVRQHQAAVYRNLYRMLGNRDDALELAQEVFVRAWQALAQWQPDAQFRTWLLRIASNAAVDALRRRRRVEFMPLDESTDVVDDGAGPERQAAARQELRHLEHSLAALSAEHRQILLLREVEHLSYEEIGRMLELNEGTVKSRLARARMALLEIHGA